MNPSHLAPPPQLDNSSAADAARRRVTPKGRLLHIPSMPNLWSSKSKRLKHRYQRASDDLALPLPTPPSTESRLSQDAVYLSGSPTAIGELPEDEDVYRWAILYENQRGVTLFSMPYYSPLSLLPHDPPPFTVPEAAGRKNLQPEVSLDEYPLPDGTWRWVSQSWMIDMRDEGEVQYDGFQYNWFFRRYKWRSEVGKLSFGGWVRRRRWVRLMMRPASTAPEPGGSESTPGSRTVSSVGSEECHSFGPGDVWKGDEDDWNRCYLLMRQLNRDGKKLEVWRSWLGSLPTVSVSESTTKRWFEDKYPPLSETGRDRHQAHVLSLPIQDRSQAENIGKVIQNHGEELLQLFVFPESRTEFIELLGCAGVLLNVDLGLQSIEVDVPGVGPLDFWSYSQNTSGPQS